MGIHSFFDLPSAVTVMVKGIPHVFFTTVPSPISFLIAAPTGIMLPMPKPASGQAATVTSFGPLLMFGATDDGLSSGRAAAFVYGAWIRSGGV